MQRQGFSAPLLIGGATTSRIHTAVKIGPNYENGQAVYVTDASRAVGVVSSLLGDKRDAYIASLRETYASVASAHERGRAQKARTSLADARRNKLKLDWGGYKPPRPSFLGVKAFAKYDLAALVPHVDWTPFFSAWDIKGTYPEVLTDSRYGEAASALYADAQAILRRIVAEGWLTANGVVGFGLRTPSMTTTSPFTQQTTAPSAVATLYTLRQQMARDGERANTALADFVAPEASGVADYVGGFAVTAGIGEEAVAERFARANDDYSKIIVKALADRLAEALRGASACARAARVLGLCERRDADARRNDRGEYRGIRPAPGYPAQPDHTEKDALFRLLNAERTTGIELTESYAMAPAASVSGLYLAHPESHYFGVGKIERDQAEDYAKRKGWPLSEAERWLAPILNYDPKPRA